LVTIPTNLVWLILKQITKYRWKQKEMTREKTIPKLEVRAAHILTQMHILGHFGLVATPSWLVRLDATEPLLPLGFLY
jgi:hypothetical protein